MESKDPQKSAEKDAEKPQERRKSSYHPLKRNNLGFLVLAIGFFLPMAYGWVRMVYSITNWYWLTFSGVQPGPLYLIISGALWGLVGLAANIWLWGRLRGYQLVDSGAALFFALTYWIDRLFVRVIASSPPAAAGSFTTGAVSASPLGGNIVFAACFTIVSVVYVLVAMETREELEAFFRKKE